MRIFKEEQRFNQLWLIILMIISAIIPLILIINEYIKHPKRFSITNLVILISLVILSCGLIFIFKLSTRIDDIGIHYKFFPFHITFKTIKWQTITKASVRNYDPISEYGGWGLKGGALWNSAKGKAINVSGDMGIQLELKNEKKLLIGTQNPEKAKSTLSYYKTKLKTTTNG